MYHNVIFQQFTTFSTTETMNEGNRERERGLGRPHFLCRLAEVTIFMSVTSSCHDKPLWVNPGLIFTATLLFFAAATAPPPLVQHMMLI